MRIRGKPFAHLDELRTEYKKRKDAIHSRLRDFTQVPPQEYFYELVYCLLTPQSSAVNAGKAVAALREADLLGMKVEPSHLLHQKEFYVRFHITKGKRILEARERFPQIAALLSSGRTPRELRSWLVENVTGLGLKEGSHFLRNIGCRDLAILDRHILRNLKRHGVVHSLPKTLTPKRYLAIEAKFAGFAEASGISMDELDLLFWSRETGKILK